MHKLARWQEALGRSETKSCSKLWKTARSHATCRISICLSNIWHSKGTRRTRQSASVFSWSTSKSIVIHLTCLQILCGNWQKWKWYWRKSHRRSASVSVSSRNYSSALESKCLTIVFRLCKSFLSKWVREQKSSLGQRLSCASVVNSQTLVVPSYKSAALSASYPSHPMQWMPSADGWSIPKSIFAKCSLLKLQARE